MLISRIRDGIKGKLGKAFLYLMFISFFGGYGLIKIFDKFWSDGVDGVVSVNGKVVSENVYRFRLDEEQQRLSYLQQMLYMQYGEQAADLLKSLGLTMDPAVAALQTIVINTLLDESADKVGIKLSPEYVQTKFQDKYFLAQEFENIAPEAIGMDGKINEAALQRVLSAYNGTDIDALLQASMKRHFFESILQSSFYIPEFLVQEAYVQNYVSKKFSIGVLSFDAVFKEVEKKGVSESDLKDFYEKQNKQSKRYIIPAKRTGIQWTFSPKDFDITVTEREIEDYYEKVKRSRFIDVPTQVKVREIVFDNVKDHGVSGLKKIAEEVYAKAIENPDSFADLAKQHSTKKETASKGGLVDFFKRGERGAPYDRAAFVTLKNDGEISPVIQIGDSFVILKRESRKEATFKPLAKVKSEVEITLREQKFRTAFTKEASALISQKDDNAQSAFDSFVEKNKGKREELDALAKNENATANRLFSLKKAGSKSAYIADGNGIILELEQILEPLTPPFGIMQPQIQQDYFSQETVKEMKKLLKLKKEEVVKVDKLVGGSGLTVTTTPWITLSNQDELKKLLEQGIPQELFGIAKVGGVATSTGQKNGYIARLDEINKLDEEDFKQKKSQVEASLFNTYRGLLMRSFVASLNRNAKIIPNKSFENVKDML